MLPGEIAGPIDGYLAALRREAPDQVAAVYAVGSLAVADFSSKQSNVDLVIVGDPPLAPAQVARLRRAEKGLERVGRRAGLWYTGWEEVAADDRPARAQATQAPAGLAAPIPAASSPPPAPSPVAQTPATPAQAARESLSTTLATPMTRAMLRQDPIALIGPDWPVVGYDEAAFRSWCSERLRVLATARKGVLVFRRAVTPVVLEASRLAQGAITGRVFSKSEAGESIGMIVAPRYRRILTDAVGYRRGAQTSMYWGPFERKYDALVLLRDLLEVAGKR
jgi:hypothetical protein